MANKKDEVDDNVSMQEQDPVATEQEQVPAAVEMDIQRYLAKKPNSRSIEDMLKVLFRGQIKTETEWDVVVNNILVRNV